VHADGSVHWHAHADDAAGDSNPSCTPAHAGAGGGQARTVRLDQPILAANERQAQRNRGFFEARGLWVWNVVSSPGSGKTTLLQKTMEALAGSLRFGVVVGDLETARDAERLRSAGVQAVQITTGTLCHLDATLVARAVTRLDLRGLDILVIENVGNLVCPAAFDLGEGLRLVLLSVTEGEDKPLKYPPIFASADVVVITKMDLAGPCAFQGEIALENIRRVAPQARVFEVSARSGEGMEAWLNFLRSPRPARTQHGPG
jgi:hydrogenase nickel incorporation protein HypB